MTTDERADPGGGKPYRLDVKTYHEMIREGIFPHDASLELLGGVLIEHARHDPRHNYIVGESGYRLRKIVPAAWFISEEKALVLGRFSRPEPDIAVIRGPHDPYRNRSPRVADVGFLIEVAETTYAYDRGVKWRAYASARIPEYWIVDLAKRQIEVYRNPVGRGKESTYRVIEVFKAGDAIPIILDDGEIGRFAIKGLLP